MSARFCHPADTPTFAPEQVAEVLAALQARPPIAAALLQAEVQGCHPERAQCEARLDEITRVLEAHGEIVQAIEAAATRHRCAVGDLRTEALADLWRHP
ncbi:hypothetical protein [Ectothiorhodospira variabilis]|uniref:hypothetical protein n=1 Tax=Ectothiorhodospira variabilis TaxID=505694 RepID=UPI001EFAFCFB|nr:hypothetical protein [Ectothiorhodospira variabilis]MCG5495527.1 hypothetical protein [Ectothiorhodospira variabilis]MCG5505135.1 hypothetical protein [Ectothiorhodospira variabilis]MCG5508292.1 hypothetical protein [Ectothiorhodospira variabilis]